MRDDKKPIDKSTEVNKKPIVQPSSNNYVENLLEADFHDTSHDPPDDNPREEFEGK